MRLLLALVVLASGPAPAQRMVFPQGDYTFNPGAERSQVLATGETLGHARFRVGLLSHGLIAPTDGAGNLVQLREHLAVAVGLGSRFQVAAQVPVFLWQSPGASPSPFPSRPWVGGRVALLRPDDADPHPYLAIDLAMGIPGLGRSELELADQRDFVGSVRVSAGLPWWHGGVFGVDLEGRVSSSARVDLRGGITFTSSGVHWKGELTARGDLRLAGGPLRGFAEALLGVRYVLRPLELSLLTGPGFGLASTGVDLRVAVGLSFVSPEDDNTPVLVARADCTEGTQYRLEACPDLDWDNDGLRNGVDRCSREFGPRQNEGCPWPDTDADTLVDFEDNCPDVPGPVSNFGCPPEKKQLVKLRKEKLEILERVYFEFDKAVIKPESFELLDQVAAVIESHAELRVRVEGHTDRVGTAEYNRGLSKARARAVKDYLTGQGHIAAARLTVAGFGFDVPIDSNDTDEGRARNRRVEFMFVDAKDPIGEP